MATLTPIRNKHGKTGWRLRSPARFRGTPWEVHAGPVTWATGTFWRVGICEERDDQLWELAHLRYDTEAEAEAAVEWLAVVAMERGR